MDFKSFFSDRLAKLELYLSTYQPNRSYALGRILEIESLSFSLRNSAFLSVSDFDQLDLQCETLRRRYRLHRVSSNRLLNRPYNGRFLPFESDSSDGYMK